MNKQLVVSMLFVLNVGLYAQDTLKVTEGPPAVVIPPPPAPPVRERPKVSAIPTAQELADLFVKTERGEFDPFEVIGKVVEKKESTVAGLNELLFSETLRGSPVSVSGDTGKILIQSPKPSKLYAVFCLRGIGSQTAYDALLKAATSHSDINIKGTALNVYAVDYLQKARSEALTPDKEVIHLFLSNIGNTAQVEYVHRNFEELALEGLKNWVDKNLDKKAIGNGEQWWTQNKDRLTWNKKIGRFEVK